jgi:hypothetical protein
MENEQIRNFIESFLDKKIKMVVAAGGVNVGVCVLC